MRQFLGLLFLCGLVGTAMASNEPSFDHRLSQAKRTESEVAPHAYIQRNIFPAMQTAAIKNRVSDCIKAQRATEVRITMAATISPDGRVVDVDYRPGASKTGYCLAHAIRAIRRLPAPPSAYARGLPIYIDWDLSDQRK